MSDDSCAVATVCPVRDATTVVSTVRQSNSVHVSQQTTVCSLLTRARLKQSTKVVQSSLLAFCPPRPLQQTSRQLAYGSRLLQVEDTARQLLLADYQSTTSNCRPKPYAVRRPIAYRYCTLPATRAWNVKSKLTSLPQLGLARVLHEQSAATFFLL